MSTTGPAGQTDIPIKKGAIVRFRESLSDRTLYGFVYQPLLDCTESAYTILVFTKNNFSGKTNSTYHIVEGKDILCVEFEASWAQGDSILQLRALRTLMP